MGWLLTPSTDFKVAGLVSSQSHVMDHYVNSVHFFSNWTNFSEVYCYCWQKKFSIYTILSIVECRWMWFHNVKGTVHDYFGKMYVWLKWQQLKLLKLLIENDCILARIFFVQSLRKCAEWKDKILEYLTEDICSVLGMIDRNRIIWHPADPT